MAESNANQPSLDAAAGAVSPQAVSAFKLLGEETRLAILLALWEAYDPESTENSLAFSELYDRVDAKDTGNFNYHLEKLTGHFVAETESGYTLQNAGHKIVQAIIAGAGIEDVTIPPTEIDRTCHRCGAPIEITYEDEYLYQVCTGCDGNFGPESIENAPRGAVMAHDFSPAGLTHRDPEAVFVDGTIEFLRQSGLLIRGVCPQCSGQVNGSLHHCMDHHAPAGEVCPHCGTKDEVRVTYHCTICKHGASFPAEAAVHDHPTIVAFREEQGIVQPYDIRNSAACARLWDHLMAYEQEVETTDPLVVRVTVPGADAQLELLLDTDLEITEVTQTSRP